MNSTKTSGRAEPLEDLRAASLRLLNLLTVHGTEEELLQKGIESLAALIGARYGAIGVVDDSGRLRQFVHTGMSAETVARIGRLPEGRGLLGVVTRENRPLRLEDMSQDPRSTGFPPHHPPMKNLLAVPVSCQDQVFGNVFLSGKHDDTPFSDEDELIVTRFADAFALTLRFHRAETERRRTQTALQDVAHAVSSISGGDFFRTLVVDLARALNVDYAFVGRLVGEQDDAVETIAVCAEGRLVDNFTYELRGTPCQRVVNGAPCHYPSGVQQQFPNDRLLKEMGVDSYVGCPLTGSGGQPLGLLVVMASRPIHDPLAMQAILQIFAAHAAAELERRGIEQALRASEEDLRALAENANDGILVNCNGRHVFANRRMADMLGYTPEEMLLTGIRDLVHPDEYDKVAGRYRARMKGEAAPTRYETVFVSRNGGSLPVEINAARTVWQGRPAGLAFVRDISERLRAEQALEQVARAVSTGTGEAFFQSMVRNLSTALDMDYAFIGVLDDENPETVHTIAGCRRDALLEPFTYSIRGAPCEYVVGKAFRHFPRDVLIQFPNDPWLAQNRIQSYVGMPLFDSGKRPLGLLALLHTQPLERVGRAESLLRIFAARTAMEIERLRQEQALRDSERRYAELIEQAPDAVVTLDLQGRLQTLNPAAERLCGYRADELSGRHFVEAGVVAPESLARATTEFPRVAGGEERPPFELVILHRSGVRIVTEINPRLVRHANQAAVVQVTLRDITERKRAEHALRENNELLERIFDSNHFSLALLDRDFNFIRVNRAYAQGDGRDPGYYQGKNHFRLYPHAENEAIFRRVVHTGESFTTVARPFEFPDHPERGVTYWDWTLQPLKNAGGEVEALVLILQDVTQRKRAEMALGQSEERFRTLVESTSDWIWEVDARGGYTYVSPKITELLGYTPGEMIGKTPFDFMPPDEAARLKPWFAETVAARRPIVRLENVNLHKDGHRVVLETNGIPVMDPEDRLTGYRGIDRDITGRKQAEDQIARLGRILDESSNEIYVFDAGSLRFVQVNRGARHNLGYSMDELRTLTPVDIKPGFDHKAFESLIAPLRRGEMERLDFTAVHRRKDGSEYPVDVQLQLMRHESPPVFVAIIQDITERKRAEERLSYLAYYDALTGLPNRAQMLERLQQAMLDAERVDRLVAVMFLDLDRFKVINDTLGHHVGDALLKAVAERLRDGVRPGDIIARLGGDEFTVVLTSVAHVDDVARVASKVLDSFREPFRVEGHELFTATSIGITLFPFDVHNAEGLLKNADAAMYHAKERGRNNFQFFTSDLNARAERRLRLESALRLALENNQISLHYQPQVDTASGRIIGLEALARWSHPELGNVSPAEFIPVAEETGLILPIGEWVLREACRQIKTWHATKFSFSKMQVAVNISGKQLRQRDFPDLVRQVLQESRLDARYLDLELTESLLMEDVDETLDAMHVLHDLGVSFSVDDFGTGYSSLAYLKRFPIDILKIDRSFVHDLATDSNSTAIVKTIIAMAHTLGMRVVAEGVETRDQLEFLRAQGCDGSQGYYCSMPLSAAEFSELLADWGRIRRRSCAVVKTTTRRRAKARPARRRKTGE